MVSIFNMPCQVCSLGRSIKQGVVNMLGNSGVLVYLAVSELYLKCPSLIADRSDIRRYDRCSLHKRLCYQYRIIKETF